MRESFFLQESCSSTEFQAWALVMYNVMSLSFKCVLSSVTYILYHSIEFNNLQNSLPAVTIRNNFKTD